MPQPRKRSIYGRPYAEGSGAGGGGLGLLGYILLAGPPITSAFVDVTVGMVVGPLGTLSHVPAAPARLDAGVGSLATLTVSDEGA